MNEQECAQVLTKIQLGDNRQVDRLTLNEWFDTIGHLRFDDAIEGVRIHRQESDKWIMPAHVIAGARRARQWRERAERAERVNRRALPPAPVITLDRAEFERLTQEAIEAHRGRSDAAL